MQKKYCKWLLMLTFWCLSAALFAQEKLTKQQQADLDKAVKEAEAEMAKLMEVEALFYRPFHSCHQISQTR